MTRLFSEAQVREALREAVREVYEGGSHGSDLIEARVPVILAAMTPASAGESGDAREAEIREAVTSPTMRGMWDETIVRHLLALLDAARARPQGKPGLPVIPTCGACGWHGAVGDGSADYHCLHPDLQDEAAPRLVDVMDTGAPPSWCPLRGAP